MLVRPHLPGYRWFHVFRNAAIRTGVYVGVCLTLVFTAWVVIANHAPFLERFALERNIAAAVILCGVLVVKPMGREKKIAICVRMTRLEGIAEAQCCKGQKADRASSASRGSARQSQSQSARLLIEATSQDQGPRICGQAQRPRQPSGLQSLRSDYLLPKDRRPYAFTECDLW